MLTAALVTFGNFLQLLSQPFLISFFLGLCRVDDWSSGWDWSFGDWVVAPHQFGALTHLLGVCEISSWLEIRL